MPPQPVRAVPVPFEPLDSDHISSLDAASGAAVLFSRMRSILGEEWYEEHRPAVAGLPALVVRLLHSHAKDPLPEQLIHTLALPLDLGIKHLSKANAAEVDRLASERVGSLLAFRGRRDILNDVSFSGYTHLIRQAIPPTKPATFTFVPRSLPPSTPADELKFATSVSSGFGTLDLVIVQRADKAAHLRAAFVVRLTLAAHSIAKSGQADASLLIHPEEWDAAVARGTPGHTQWAQVQQWYSSRGAEFWDQQAQWVARLEMDRTVRHTTGASDSDRETLQLSEARYKWAFTDLTKWIQRPYPHHLRPASATSSSSLAKTCTPVARRVYRAGEYGF
ncbi:hypothetical protein JCM10213_005965 [Rhodosporidiobolus nylandii]